MAGLCEGGNEPPGSLKASKQRTETKENCPAELKLYVFRGQQQALSRPPLYGARTRYQLKVEANMRVIKKATDVACGILRRFINNSGYLASERDEDDNAGEVSPGSSTESYPAFAHIGLRENPGKNLSQVTSPNRESNLATWFRGQTR
ncbi:hypothetical protein ANN_00004 [Periplaneta americana]|uniref:Uncharacterized protein n=1 Tax=Periplaneta americana TaxID=6978 RepID=A0ABQ8TPN3_PERAM|nr:hypothetical protein ANN_00004 [Periplaneta americana]